MFLAVAVVGLSGRSQFMLQAIAVAILNPVLLLLRLVYLAMAVQEVILSF